VGDSQHGIQLLLRFCEENDVAVLLGTSLPEHDPVTSAESRLVARFLRETIEKSPELTRVLKRMMEGLVLCNAAFLRDIAQQRRQFKNLTIFLDSNVIRRALGYEGDAEERLAREALRLLTSANATCKVLEPTVEEIQRILALYESKLATPEGKKSLFSYEMARHFLRSSVSPSDVRQMRATLLEDIKGLGIRVVPIPTHVAAWTLDEAALQKSLSDWRSGDDSSPRIRHDVDAVAAVLTLRKGRYSDSIDECGHVFATDTLKVVVNVERWFSEQGCDGVAPVVHLRSLLNLAWLRCPALAGDLKIHELVALCSAALRPSPTTWERFKKHLDQLVREGRLSSDEMMAIVATQLTDTLLADGEDDERDGDASTFDEVVQRVKEAYRQEADAHVAVANQELRDARAHAEAADRRWRNIELAVTRRARRAASLVGKAAYWVVLGLVLIAAVAIIASDGGSSLLSWGNMGILFAVAVIAVVLLETFGRLRQAEMIRDRVEAAAFRVFHRWLASMAGLGDASGDRSVDR